MKFKDLLDYGDLTGQTYEGDIDLHSKDLLTSLEGCPKIIKGDFDASGCDLRSLKGAPEIVTGDFLVRGNKKLTSLRYSPKKVGVSYSATFCDLISLNGCTQDIGENLNVFGNKNLKDLKGGPTKLSGSIMLWTNHRRKHNTKYPIKAIYDLETECDIGADGYTYLDKPYAKNAKLMLNIIEKTKRVKEKMTWEKIKTIFKLNGGEI